MLPFEDNENPISYHCEGLEFLLPDPGKITSWLTATAQAEGKGLAALNYIFCSDEYLHRLNVDYLQHDTYTDVITFQYSDPEESLIAGDIFISVERTAENAQKFAVSPENELYRVMVHGLLHLIGYEDKTTEKQQIMRSKEDEYLTKLKS